MEHKNGAHQVTPTKARLQEAAKLVDELKARNPAGKYPTRRQLFRDHKVLEATGRRILKQKDPRRLTNSKIRPETRGVRSKFDERDLRYVELILWYGGFNSRELTWENLATKVDLGYSGRTLRRHLLQLNYRRCLACLRSQVALKAAALRVSFTERILAKYLLLKDQYNVRFSDEVHLGFRSVGRVFVIRKPGEVHCPDCVIQKDEPKKEHEKKVHGWGAVGYNFKSPLLPYKTNNSNGKMT